MWSLTENHYAIEARMNDYHIWFAYIVHKYIYMRLKCWSCDKSCQHTFSHTQEHPTTAPEATLFWAWTHHSEFLSLLSTTSSQTCYFPFSFSSPSLSVGLSRWLIRPCCDNLFNVNVMVSSVIWLSWIMTIIFAQTDDELLLFTFKIFSLSTAWALTCYSKDTPNYIDVCIS